MGRQIDALVDGWIEQDGLTNGWIGWWMDGFGWIGEWVDRWMDWQMDGRWMDWRMDGLVDGRIGGCPDRLMDG
ncbi:hypothetical protein HOY80DRAFT_943583 [Tuber brumale]|nr:hypothetical protein HOY80DRAFT_943583 [Tuber brumale]